MFLFHVYYQLENLPHTSSKSHQFYSNPDSQMASSINCITHCRELPFQKADHLPSLRHMQFYRLGSIEHLFHASYFLSKIQYIDLLHGKKGFHFHASYYLVSFLHNDPLCSSKFGTAGLVRLTMTFLMFDFHQSF